MGIDIRNTYYKNITDEEWNDYKWQFKNRIKTVEELDKITQQIVILYSLIGARGTRRNDIRRNNSSQDNWISMFTKL